MPARTVFVLAFPGLDEVLVNVEVENIFRTGYICRGRPAGIYLFIYLSIYLSTMQDCILISVAGSVSGSVFGLRIRVQIQMLLDFN